MNLNSPKLNYIIMISVVFLCAFEYIFAKPILESVPALTVIWFKYVISFAVLICIKLVRGIHIPFILRDMPVFVALALLGEVFYYLGSFSALSYLPVALVTVVIAMAPVLSIVFDRFIYKRKIRIPVALGVGVSLMGIFMVAGVDIGMVTSGRFIGYLLAVLPAVCANLYNVIAIKLTTRYSTFEISFYIIGATAIICTPYGLSHLPASNSINVFFVLTVVYLGVMVASYGLFAYVNSLKILGATTTLLFSNFVPVVACVFGWLFLKETILPLQLVGGAIALIGCAAVIWYKGRIEILEMKVKP